MVIPPSNPDTAKGICVTAKNSFGPDDDWPRHSQPRMNEAFTLARSYGWTLTPRRNHQTYELSCPDGTCTKVVYSTGRGNESFAKTLMTFIRRCCHNAALTATLVKAVELVGDGERLLDAVEHHLVSTQLSDELAKRIETGEGDDEIENFLEAVEKKEAEAVAALEALTASGDARDAVKDAETRASEARNSLKSLDRGNKEVDEAWQRCKQLRDRVTACRQRLEGDLP